MGEPKEKGLEMIQGESLPLGGRVIACAAAIAMAVSVALGGFGGIRQANALQTGGLKDNNDSSITVHKLASEYPGGPGISGTEIDKPGGASVVPGAKFKLIKLQGIAVEGLNGVPALNAAPSYSAIDNLSTIDGTSHGASTWAQRYMDASFPVTEQTTGSDGSCKWEGLRFGYYLLVETAAPEGYKDASSTSPSIVTLPFAQAKPDASPTFTKDVHVYPKNQSKVKKQSSKSILDMQDASGKKATNVTAGTVISYRIAFDAWPDGKLGSDKQWASATARDYLPCNVQGEPVFDLVKDSEKVFLKLAGKSDPILAKNAFGTYFKPAASESSSDLTKNGAKLNGRDDIIKWETTDDGALAQAVKTTNGENPNNKVEAVYLEFKLKANDKVNNVKAGADNKLVNKYDVNTKDGSGADVVKGDAANPSNGEGAGHVGLSFFKSAATDAGAPDMAKLLPGAKFLVAESEAAYKVGKWLGVADANGQKKAFVVESGGEGKVELGALDPEKLVNVELGNPSTGALSETTGASQNGENATDFKKFLNDLAPGKSGFYTFYVYETHAPNGYKPSNKVYEVPVSYSKALDGTVSWSVPSDKAVYIPNYNHAQTGENGGMFPLPNTGGTGAALIVGAGVLLMVGGGVFIALDRRRKKNGK